MNEKPIEGNSLEDQLTLAMKVKMVAKRILRCIDCFLLKENFMRLLLWFISLSLCLFCQHPISKTAHCSQADPATINLPLCLEKQ